MEEEEDFGRIGGEKERGAGVLERRRRKIFKENLERERAIPNERFWVKST
jgi:hypothetical protein